MMKEKTDLDKLNEFLILVANTKSGIRRKIVAIEKYLKELKEKNEV